MPHLVKGKLPVKAKYMEEKKSVLPVDFDGVFRFTNYTDHEFKARWNNVEYTFPANKTTPMVIPGATPEEVQHIRKKFAKELAVAQFYESEKFKRMNAHIPGGTPPLYTDTDLSPFIQKCLEPLPLAQAVITPLPKDSEDKYRKDRKGRNVTRVLDQDESLLEKGAQSVE